MGKLIVLVGLPGSGKSTYAKRYKEENNTEEVEILSSDALRREMFGYLCQDRNQELFSEMFKRTVAFLKENKTVIYDATNISSNDVLKAVTNTYRLAVYRKCVIPEYAKIIDDYFTMFGYATRRVKYPNVRQYPKGSLRPHWNFIKTQGCVIHSSRTLGKGLPAEAEAQISKIYDNGITFWMDGNEIGDYSLDNSPPAPKNGG